MGYMGILLEYTQSHSPSTLSGTMGLRRAGDKYKNSRGSMRTFRNCCAASPRQAFSCVQEAEDSHL